MLGVLFVILISLITGISNRVNKRSYFIYITAWGIFFISNIISILAGLKLLPYSKFLLYSPKIEIILVIVMFSLALADRIQHSEYLRGIESEKGIMLKKLNIMNGRLTSTRDIKKVISYLSMNVTVSIGIAYKNEFTKSVYALSEAADKALYEAKEKGRNLVIEYTV